MFRILLITLFTLMIVGCSSVETRDESYTVLTHTGTLSTADVGGLPPQDAVLYGDTLYVLSRGVDSGTALTLIENSSMTVLDSWATWTDTAGVQGTLTEGMSLTATADRFYICSEGSRVDVFDRQTMEYITTIGKGNWWADDSVVLVHAFALAENNGKVIIRDKHQLRVYNVDDLTYENRKNVLLQAKSINLGTNGGKKPYGMVVVDEKLFVTGYDRKEIHVFETTQFGGNDTAIAPIDTIVLDSRPYDIAEIHGALYIVFSNGTVEKRSPSSYELLKQFNGFEYGAFEYPSTLQFGAGMFYMVEDSLEEISYGTVDEFSVKVYEEE